MALQQMPAYHDIQMRFIRRRDGGVAEPDPRKDDTLTVTKLGENNLRIIYTERTEDGVLRDSVLMGYQRFFHYVWRLLWLLSVDSDPFQNVQLMIPGYPTVLIPVATVNQHVPAILDILMTTCWQWPTVRRGEEIVAPPTPPTRGFGESPLQSQTHE